MREGNPLLGAYGKDIWTGPHFNYTFHNKPTAEAVKGAGKAAVFHAKVPMGGAKKQAFSSRGLMPLLQEKRRLFKMENIVPTQQSSGSHGTRLENGTRVVSKAKGGSKRGKRSGIPIL